MLFNYNYEKMKDLRIGYVKSSFNPDGYNYKNDSAMLVLIKSKGIKLIEKEIPNEIPISALRIILTAESSAAFDELKGIIIAH